MDDLRAQPAATIVFPLSALLVLLFSFETRSALLEVWMTVVCGLLLVSRAAQKRAEVWYVAAAALVAFCSARWLAVANHGFLVAYWCLVCALAAGSDRPCDVLARNARLLIGLSFLLAVLWKVRNPDYLDGSVMEYLVVTGAGRNLATAAAWLGRMSPEQVARNAAREAEFLATPDARVSDVLEVTDGVHLLARFVTGWGLLIEIALAVAFLATSPRLLRALRDPLLLVFIYSSYPLLPVVLFAHVMAVMGIAQSPADRPLVRAAYLLSFPAVQLARIPLALGLG